MIYTKTVTMSADAVVGVFDQLGISPGRNQVTLQHGSTNGTLQICQDSSGTNPGTVIPLNPGGGGGATEVSAGIQLITDKDEVYVINSGGVTDFLNILVSEVP